MANLDLLMRSLEFIEDHLEDTVAVQTEDDPCCKNDDRKACSKYFRHSRANIEWYGDGDPSSSDYHSAIWIPVKKK